MVVALFILAGYALVRKVYGFGKVGFDVERRFNWSSRIDIGKFKVRRSARAQTVALSSRAEQGARDRRVHVHETHTCTYTYMCEVPYSFRSLGAVAPRPIFARHYLTSVYSESPAGRVRGRDHSGLNLDHG